MEETRFYLLMVINEKFSQYMINEHKFMLIDMWYEQFEKIHKDFLKYDNSNKALLTCIYEYVENNENDIKAIIDMCCENTFLVK